jgi:hypothetical protein
MIAYKITYINSYGEREDVGITDNLEKWLKHNNEIRVGDGNEPESLDDFEIEQVDIEIFNEE